MRYVGNKIATSLFYTFGLGEITQHGYGSSAGHGGGSHVEGTARHDGRGPGGEHLPGLTRITYRGQEVGVANSVDKGCVLASAMGNQFVHGLVRPLHAIIRIDGDDGILHAVEQGFELTLAGLQSGEVFFQMARGFVERCGDLADFI